MFSLDSLWPFSEEHAEDKPKASKEIKAVSFEQPEEENVGLCQLMLGRTSCDSSCRVLQWLAASLRGWLDVDLIKEDQSSTTQENSYMVQNERTAKLFVS